MPQTISYGTDYHKKQTSVPTNDFGYATNYRNQKTSSKQSDFGYKTDYHKKLAMAVKDNGYASVYHKQKAIAQMNPGYASNYNEQPIASGSVKNPEYSASWSGKRTDHKPEATMAKRESVRLNSTDFNYPTEQRGSTVKTKRKGKWRMSDGGVVRY